MQIRDLTLDDVGALMEITETGGSGWFSKLRVLFYPKVWEGQLTSIWYENGVMKIGLDGVVHDMSKEYYVDIVD